MIETLQVTKDQGILEIAFNRPERKNALTLAMYDEAARALSEANDDKDVRCVVLRGLGGHFSSGNDLRDFMSDPPVNEDSPVFRFLLALRRSFHPVIAAVEGYAIGIGTTMLLHCDLVYAHKDTRFRLPFVELGLVPEAGSSLLLSQMAGHRLAAELLYLGDFFDVEMASRCGIINEVVEDDVSARALQVAGTLAQKSPQALRLTKSLLRRGDEAQVLEAMRAEAAIFAARLSSPDFAQAVAKFMGK
ncbi:enoyl-CoA hydratase [Lujinxingia litoralis]|uniref:Enoyl-CoA hydratase n=1 Tax=Lujinxingia litoralis TaxID=2211119 RepID=A0A328C9N2_9DELT|nr:enoyl-CoA hydratase [Lujinxingia litoralis]RAL22333.1 enoyl-CoA hydratase [Lujinxingia litoralis]